MRTLNEIRFAIFNRVRPSYTGEKPLSLELIEWHIINVRAQLIREDLNKHKSIDPFIIQDLGCVTLEQADKGCCDVPTNCYILRTSIDIPSTIELDNKTLITRVGPVDFTKKPFQQIEFSRVPFAGDNRFTKNEVKWFIKNKRVYLLINKSNPIGWGLETINLQAVLEDPTEARNFSTCNGDSCFTEESDFPIKARMLPTLIQLVVEKFIGPQAIAPIDNSSDKKPNLDQQTTS
jgi:hypothetical protein